MLVSRVTDPRHFVLIGIPPRDLVADVARAVYAVGLDFDEFCSFVRMSTRAASHCSAVSPHRAAKATKTVNNIYWTYYAINFHTKLGTWSLEH